MQNGYIERKNGSLRRELLNAYLLNSLSEVRWLSEEWRIDYNTERPHKSLGYLSPLLCLIGAKKAQDIHFRFIHKRRTKIIHKLKSGLVDKIFKKPKDR